MVLALRPRQSARPGARLVGDALTPPPRRPSRGAGMARLTGRLGMAWPGLHPAPGFPPRPPAPGPPRATHASLLAVARCCGQAARPRSAAPPAGLVCGDFFRHRRGNFADAGPAPAPAALLALAVVAGGRKGALAVASSTALGFSPAQLAAGAAAASAVLAQLSGRPWFDLLHPWTLEAPRYPGRCLFFAFVAAPGLALVRVPQLGSWRANRAGASTGNSTGCFWRAPRCWALNLSLPAVIHEIGGGAGQLDPLSAEHGGRGCRWRRCAGFCRRTLGAFDRRLMVARRAASSRPSLAGAVAGRVGRWWGAAGDGPIASVPICLPQISTSFVRLGAAAAGRTIRRSVHANARAGHLADNPGGVAVPVAAGCDVDPRGRSRACRGLALRGWDGPLRMRSRC